MNELVMPRGLVPMIRYKTYDNTEGKLMARLTEFHRQQTLFCGVMSLMTRGKYSIQCVISSVLQLSHAG
jgi:hypothetical protein